MVNKAILVGNLGKDPELTYTPSGVAVCKVSLATSERWTDKSGERKERTDWHNLVFWRRNAEVANEYLRKGSQIFVEGRISNRSYEDRDGNRKYISEIEVQNFQMLGRRGDGGGGGGGTREAGGSSDAGSRGSGSSKSGEEGIHYDYDQKSQTAGGEERGFGSSSDDDDLPF